MVNKRKVFNKGERDLDLINLLLKLPLEERKKEIKHCDLTSLARTMESFPSWQVDEIASAMPPNVRKEFIRVVKIYKGDIPVPKKVRKVEVKQKKKGVLVPIVIAVSIGVVILMIEALFP